MNERIEDLMYRAGLIAQGCWDEMDSYDKQAIEKFAELIVRECAELVKDFYQEDEFTCYSAKTEIKEHFGVEE